MSDITETQPRTNAFEEEQKGYKQSLGPRHVQMIAIGGAIGTGLFLGSASRLNSTGPALILSYAFVGVVAFFLMRALGELVLYRQTSSAFVSYMREFFGEKGAYYAGWMYWITVALSGVAELSAVGLYVQYWWPLMPTWATVLIALTAVLGVNLLSARAFGEFEFWAAILKVLAIVVFLVVGAVVVVFTLNVGTHQAGLFNLWSNPGGFWPTMDPYNWYGPILVMSGVVFAYAGIEMIGVAAGEMKDPEKQVPKAVNTVLIRIGIFYCGSILLLVSMLPTTSYKAGVSPFVTVFESMGLTWIGNAMQAILIIAAMSALNATLYATGRVVRGLGMSSQAPAFTLRMSKSGVPWPGIVMTCVVFVFGSVFNAVFPNAFEIALEVTAIGQLFTWTTIFLAQYRMRRLADRGVIPKSPFRMPGYPWSSYFCFAFIGLVLAGIAITGWQSSPYFWHKTGFIIVVFGPIILVTLLELGWRICKPKVIAQTGGRLQSMWAEDGPRYADQTKEEV